MASIGERLREERVRRGLTLEQVAELTKIHATMLEAIETENFDRLPGGFFARSFIRQYARVLGVDEAQFDTELKQLTGFQAPPVAPVDEGFRPEIGRGPVRGGLRRSRTRSRQPLGALIAFLLIVAVCSAIYAFWERTRMAANAPAALRSQPALAPQQYPVRSVTPPGTQLPVQVASSPQAAAPAAAGPAHPVPPVAAAAQSAPVQVDVRARGEVWVRVVSGGKTQFEGTLQEDESRSFTGDKPLVVRFGRPSFVDVTWNGKPTGPLQPAGIPLSVEFSPETFRILRPAATPPDDAP